MVTTKLNLSMTEPQVRQIYAKQGDTGRVLDITLDQTPEDGTLRILRPDGTEVTSEAVTGGEVSESGETVTFDSLTEADVTELTVGIESVQNLNGYDAPWVGGAGKNLVPPLPQSTTVNGITWTVQSDGTVTAAGTTTGTSAVNWSIEGYMEVGSSYVLSGCPSGGSGATHEIMIITAPGGGGLVRDFGTGVTINPWLDTYKYIQLAVRHPQSNVNLTFKPMICKFSATNPTIYEPYSNICPITGHDEVTVTDEGKNLFDVSLGQYKALNSTTGEVGADNPIRFTGALTDLSDGTYTFSFGSNMFIIGIAFYDKSGNFKRYDAKNFSTTAQTFSVESEKIRLYCGSAQNHNDLVDGLSVGQLELGSTATAYEPYRSNTYTTSLGQTVYGGSLDMVTGVLTVDKAMVDLGSLTWMKETIPDGYRFRAILAGAQVADTDHETAICTQYALVATGMTYARQQGFTIASDGRGVYVYDASQESATVSEFTTAVTGQQLVYGLATPQTYTLTPQQIKTLVGTNNVWASSGDIVNITFTYGGLLSELPSDATEIVGKCYCDIEQNGVSSMPFTLNVKKNERES